MALALLGARRPLLPYQGSKWRFRKALLSLYGQLGFDGAPSSMALEDAGPWGRVAPTCVDPQTRALVIDHLEQLAKQDPREVYDRLHQADTPLDDARFAAEFLFLQRLSFSGKAVGDPDGRWASPGFNTSSAYGLPATDRFGAVNPMIPSLLRVLRGYDVLSEVTLYGARRSALEPDAVRVHGPTLVYIDPPYARSTGYPGGTMDRHDVVAVALRWWEAGAAVVVSEGETVHELVLHGFQTERIDQGRKDTSRFRGKQEEWVTYAAPKPNP